MEGEGATGNPDMSNPSGGSLGGSPGVDGSEGSRLTEMESQLAALESRRRDLQAEADRAKAALSKAEARVAELSASEQRLADIEEKLANLQMPSVDDIAAKFVATMSREQALTAFKAELAGQYKGVDVNVLRGETPEELKAAAEAENARFVQIRDEALAEAQRLFKERTGQSFSMDDGNQDPDDQGAGGVPGSGVLTAEDFFAMSEAQQDALSETEFNRLMAEVAASGRSEWRALSTGASDATR